MSLNDPQWGRGGGDGNKGGPNQGPPDLEELWRDVNRRLSGIFGRKSGGSGGSGGGDAGRQAGAKLDRDVFAGRRPPELGRLQVGIEFESSVPLVRRKAPRRHSWPTARGGYRWVNC